MYVVESFFELAGVRYKGMGKDLFGVSLLFVSTVVSLKQAAAPTTAAAFAEPSYLTLPHQQCPPLALVP